LQPLLLNHFTWALKSCKDLRIPNRLGTAIVSIDIKRKIGVSTLKKKFLIPSFEVVLYSLAFRFVPE